ncbi:alpha/beta fold hydrolase [Aquisalimonas asiatica]|uniref:Alpha/beta hydrolase family protein n=1 Tax=Aquisalimonas asiatica TaxID=406100 RepID=A0A1H8PYB6_9GAMM|nr:alpha/beta hydrolase [Aquisalimonas asiatica]SEO46920.1 Alpha/beta hydrolase family protein [Aquisalimonas asiatica]
MSARNYLLVPGAWTGAWVWHYVEQALRARRQNARSMTLSGLETLDGDVSAIRLSTHVQEVMQYIHERDLQDVILVGHGYGGLVIGQVADLQRERIAHTVYVDASLPRDRHSMVDTIGLDPAHEARRISANNGRWPAPDAEALQQEAGLSTEHARFLSERLVGHPGHAVTDPAVLDRPLHHQAGTVITSDTATTPDHPNHWRTYHLDAGPWPMLSAPLELTSLLTHRSAGPEAACKAG